MRVRFRVLLPARQVACDYIEVGLALHRNPAKNPLSFIFNRDHLFFNHICYHEVDECIFWARIASPTEDSLTLVQRNI